MKVIGFDKALLKKATCGNCTAIIEYSDSNVSAYHGKDISGGSDGKEWINCPNCSKEVILKSW